MVFMLSAKFHRLLRRLVLIPIMHRELLVGSLQTVSVAVANMGAPG